MRIGIRKYYKIYLLSLIFGSIFGQSISGIVFDSNGIPLAGANIIVSKTNIGTATDVDGSFSFKYNPSDNITIVFSYIGYQTLRNTYSMFDDLTNLKITLIKGNLFGKEVTVLARRREESIKDVPISMVAISESMIRDLGASSLEDLTAVVPNVFSYEEQTTLSFNIRGITGGARNPGMSSAEGVYLDGVIMGRPEFIVTDMVDIKSVEFLRGPQGTLFGRNTVSGDRKSVV